MRIDVEHAKEELPDLIEEVIAGHDVVITLDQQPVAKLVRVVPDEPRRRTFGSAAHQMVMSADFDEPLEDFEPYRR